jgi:hypothetical protein
LRETFYAQERGALSILSVGQRPFSSSATRAISISSSSPSGFPGVASHRDRYAAVPLQQVFAVPEG